MQRILISECLLGEPVRYDGQAKGVASPLIKQWRAQGRLVSLCPEVAGGLSTPRPPAERQGQRVVTEQGEDVSAAFRAGAERALMLCQQQGISLALLKANSPSCGNAQIYDGRFSGTLIAGQGLCAELLQQHGIQVFNEQQLAQLEQAIQRLES